MSMTKNYTRIVVTDDGGSVFEDAELQLGEVDVGAGIQPMLVGPLGTVHGVAYCTFADFGREPHTASDPQWVVVLAGELEVEVSDGMARRFRPGDLLLAADTSGRGHITRVMGGTPVHALGISTDAPNHDVA